MTPPLFPKYVFKTPSLNRPVPGHPVADPVDRDRRGLAVDRGPTGGGRTADARRCLGLLMILSTAIGLVIAMVGAAVASVKTVAPLLPAASVSWATMLLAPSPDNVLVDQVPPLTLAVLIWLSPHCRCRTASPSDRGLIETGS